MSADLVKQPWIRSFYLAISIWMLIMATVGFWPTYFGPMLTGNLSMKPILHLHAVIFLGWMLVLTVQTSLILSRRLVLHRKLGLFGVVYGVLIVAVGVWTTFDRFLTKLAEETVRAAHQSLVIPLFDLVLFIGFFSAAVLYRRRPEVHKRLMLVATLVLLGPAVARMSFLSTIPQVFVVILSPILLGMVFDLITRRRVSAVYLIGIISFIASGIRLPLRESEGWFKFSQWVFELFT